MNVYLMVDIEGISGIYCREQVVNGLPRFDEGRRYMTREVNLVADELKKNGVEKVYVRDAHGGSYSLRWDDLSANVDVAVCGTERTERFPGIADCDAVILLGYHAMAGTAFAVLEHTWSSAGIQNCWLNGEKVGETAIDAAFAGEAGKPVIMVSGDDKLCAEAKRFLPWVETAEVKKGMDSFGAMLLPPAAAEKVLRESVRKAVKDFRDGKMKLYQPALPLTFRVEYTERTPIPDGKSRPVLRALDGRTAEVTAPTVSGAVWNLL